MSGVRAQRGIARLSRRGRLLAALGLALATTAGVLWWQAARGPGAVEVPDRVCGGALSGRTVADVLPKRGEPFEESLDADTADDSEEGYDVWCRVAGGGESILAGYSWYRVSAVDRLMEKNPDGHIRLGPAKGLATTVQARLFLPCRGAAPEGRGWLEVELMRWDDRSKPRAERVPLVQRDEDAARLTELTAEAARHLSGFLSCEGDPLPAGTPDMDWLPTAPRS
ncbi:hypothetical protein [Streptomyces sp. NPDC058548]|uniref:hypothetical protein n=1 Tax=Streptomyces sp. NPDC058548 TaxID=3346545 RepID=UPI003648FAF5